MALYKFCIVLYCIIVIFFVIFSHLLFWKFNYCLLLNYDNHQRLKLRPYGAIEICLLLFGYPVACIAGYRVTICFASVPYCFFFNDFCQPYYLDFYWTDFHAVFTVRFRYGCR